MKRRTVLQAGLGLILGRPLFAAVQRNQLDAAAEVLQNATATGQVHAAALHVQHGNTTFSRAFGAAKSPDDMFLLASISKTITAAAVMTLYDKGELRLDDPVKKFIPNFTGDGRDNVTIQHLLTHVSGLPDQLPENTSLRQRHAPLSEFVDHAIRTPLLFPPGSRYQYSSMAILLASEIAQRITDIEFRQFVDESVFQPLEMKRAALGLGRFQMEDMIRNQTENAAPESGSGDVSAKDWDWNSLYWRTLGAPWGTAHASAPDVARFFEEFLHPTERMLQPNTARLMVKNHNPPGFNSRGLGFDIGSELGGPGCSNQTFGHTGSTGTLAWADPATETVCVVLTTLPGRSANPHPRKLASDEVVQAVN